MASSGDAGLGKEGSVVKAMKKEERTSGPTLEGNDLSDGHTNRYLS